ncbi:MAG: cytochrome C oxidase subunit IV family protein [Candidatus Omnitrophica bacterium]|nr:cytochrome C oxidase subunit IV family protein [Candidatus Omnitrophota bacterium]
MSSDHEHTHPSGEEHHSFEEVQKHIQKHVRIYISVFAALMVLTLVTVAASYLHLSLGQAVTLALCIAIIKGSLVAGFFMHLMSEKKTIYLILIIAAVFIVGLFSGTWLFHSDIVHN